MAVAPPYVVASVLTWNEYDDTRRCLASLQNLDYDNLDIVLVDNNSTDGSVPRLRKEFPDIEIIENEQNLGFAKAQNRAIDRALERGAKYVWIFNNDVVIPPDCLSQLIERAEADPSIGLLTPRIVDGDHTWFSYGRVNTRSGAINAGPLARLRRRLLPSNSDTELIENDYAPLCCSLISSEVFANVGLLPEPYFIYTEDVDFCLRMKANGYRIVTDTNITVEHAASSSSGGVHNPVTNYYVARNRWILRRQFASIRSYRFLPAYASWVVKRTLLALAKNRPDGAKAVLEGTIDGFRHSTDRGRYP